MMTFFKSKTILKLTLSAVLSFGGGITALGVLSAPTAQAQIQSSKAVVNKALAQGLIGETVSGYLAPVQGAVVSQGVRNAMNEINIGRKSVYTRLAREQNLSVEVVAALTGEKQIAKAPAGQKVLDRSGTWRTK